MDITLLSPEARASYAWTHFQMKHPEFAPTVGNSDQIEHHLKLHHLPHDLPSMEKAFISCCSEGRIRTHRQAIAYMNADQARKYLLNFNNELPTEKLPTLPTEIE